MQGIQIEQQPVAGLDCHGRVARSISDGVSARQALLIHAPFAVTQQNQHRHSGTLLHGRLQSIVSVQHHMCLQATDPHQQHRWQ